MRELLKDDVENQIKEGYYTSPQIGSGGFGQAQIKRQGAAIGYGVDASSLTDAASLTIGSQKLSETDIEQLKAVANPRTFSNERVLRGVKILLERMKSNPEDFELLDYDASLMHSVKGKFYEFATAIEGVILGKTDKDRPWKDWQYFTDASAKP
jgi:hypothetical protein